MQKNKSILTYNQLIKQHLNILKKLQYKSGLFAASKKKINTGYDKAWLRDNFYECLAFEVIGDWDTVEKTYNAIIDIFLKHENKIDHAINKKPKHKHQYIHPRYHPKTFNEFWEEWGNKQNDSIGAILFQIGELESNHKRTILKDKSDSTKRNGMILRKSIFLSSVTFTRNSSCLIPISVITTFLFL